VISVSDFVKLPYTPDLTEGGIAYAIRSLTYSFDPMSGSLYSRLRRIVGSVVVELAFRRYLTQQGIPFEVKGVTTFSDANRYDVSLGGHRCDIKTYITSKRYQIMGLRRDPRSILSAPALIPEEDFGAAIHQDADLYLFAFLLGLTTNSSEDIQKALQAEQPVYLIHPLRPGWAQPEVWAPLGRLALKSECPVPMTVEIGGLDASRNFVSETITLAPLTRVFATNSYYCLTYLHADGLPLARLGLQCARMNEIYLIQPHEWGNIWVYGMEIWLAGYMSHDEFRHKSSAIFAGSRVFQYSKTQTKNRSVPVADLHALEDLFGRVTEWNKAKKPR
jgi:hypothetical protein